MRCLQPPQSNAVLPFAVAVDVSSSTNTLAAGWHGPAQTGHERKTCGRSLCCFFFYFEAPSTVQPEIVEALGDAVAVVVQPASAGFARRLRRRVQARPF
jgi:hypothetical protein